MDYEMIRSCLSRLYVNIDRFVMAAYRQDDYNARGINREIMNSLQDLMNKYMNDILKDEEFQESSIIQELDEILNSICMAQENEDFLYVADLYASQLKVLIERLMYFAVMRLNVNDVIVDNSSNCEYVIEYSNAGVPILKVCERDKQFYLHSNINPYMEAEMFISPKTESVKPVYVVYGLGMGYHIWALHNQCPYAEITVFESDKYVMEMFNRHARIILFDSEMEELVHVVYDPDYSKFAKALSESKDATVIIHQPSLRLVRNSEIREKMENFLISTNSIMNSGRFLDGNFYENTKGEYHLIDEIKEEFSGKNIIFIAGGPSLDGNMDYLKKISEKYIIVSVGTVFRKLLQAQIIPDYIIMTDSKPNMINQIMDCQADRTTLLYLATCDKNSVKYYSGRKYMLLQNEYGPAEELALKTTSTLFSTGGSVSTTAIEVFIKFNCRKIVCVGLDLAIPNGKTHADATLEKRTIDEEGCRQVKAVDGGMVTTLKNLDIYRTFIENRVKQPNGVEFINSSQGAYIHGMKHMSLNEALS